MLFDTSKTEIVMEDHSHMDIFPEGTMALSFSDHTTYDISLAKGEISHKDQIDNTFLISKEKQEVSI